MNRSREIVVGAVILLGIAVVVVGALWLSGGGLGRPAYAVDVLVQDVGQLREGNAVKYRGVAIGQVDGFVVEDDGGAIRILLRLDQSLPSMDDAVAIVAPESLFGEWQVELVDRARFPRFPYFKVPPDATQTEGGPVLGGYTLPDITRLTAAANEISENLAVLTDRVDRAFNEETAENVRLAIDNIQDVSQTLRELVNETSSGLAEIAVKVNDASDDVGAAAQSARRTLDQLDGIMASGRLDSILVNVSSGTRDAAIIARELGASAGEMREVVRRADSTFTRVDRLTARIEEGEGVIGQLMQNGQLVTNATDALLQLNLLLEDLRLNPKRYVRLSIF